MNTLASDLPDMLRSLAALVREGTMTQLAETTVSDAMLIAADVIERTNNATAVAADELATLNEQLRRMGL